MRFGVDREPPGQQLGDEVAVRGDDAGQHAGSGPELGRVRQVAVVAEGKTRRPDRAVHRLGVVPGTGAGRRVPHVPEGVVAL